MQEELLNGIKDVLLIAIKEGDVELIEALSKAYQRIKSVGDEELKV